ncbi:hypothetical protein EVAR_64956_1 [Eumeta japonica]|uniref:Uncharacterized protein n=1 Tax=Eumeta variegata TaxID=151549 RepID=A0A4C1ZFA2_EUMVA|nr:hypothetical protein EVAR_64956_1 [Eumeta japonica]
MGPGSLSCGRYESKENNCGQKLLGGTPTGEPSTAISHVTFGNRFRYESFFVFMNGNTKRVVCMWPVAHRMSSDDVQRTVKKIPKNLVVPVRIET